MLKYSVSVAALAAGLVLSACSGGGGGGGIGSAGGSAPGAGSAPAPSPAPTPTPTPTPNTSLLALNSSETFTNDGATATATFPTTGATQTITVATAPISVAYDANARSYTITSGSRSQTFLPSDRDAATSTAQLTMFKRTSGNKTDAVALTAIGTSGAFTYQYVGAGYWQHTEEGTDAITGTIDAFTYGIRTKDSAMPRTGFARYAIDLIGIESGYQPQIAAIAGSGTMDVDFAGGQILFSGSGLRKPVTDVPPYAYNPNFDFSGKASLTAGTAAFNGQMTVDAAGSTLSGRFFGPAAEEVGASFTIGTASSVYKTVGTITGRKRSGDSVFTPLAGLVGAQTFSLPGSGSLVNATVQNSRGAQPGTVASAVSNSNSAWTSLGYDPAAKSYAFDGRTFAAPNAVAAESSDGVTTYRQVDGDKTATLRIYTPTGSNGSVALTYSGFADYIVLQQPATGTTDAVTRTWSVYGAETLAANMPRTGSATYIGQIYGDAYRNGYAAYDMRGTSSIVVNFGGGSVSGELHPIFTPVGSGSALDLGGLRIVAQMGSPIGSTKANAFQGAAVEMNNATRATVQIDGRFFGPTAQELGANVVGYWMPSTSNANDILWFHGVAAGKR